MELFPDGAHVRLRSREQGTYLHADEDGWGVSLSPHRASLNTAWAVHLVPPAPHTGATTTYVLLHSAAYGRYLGVRHELDHPVVVLLRRTVQCLYDTPLQADVLWSWEAVSTEDGREFLRLVRNQNLLNNSPWTVEAIPPRPAPPQLPDEIPNGPVPVVLRRMIRYIRADNSGMFILRSRGTFHFDGRSLRDLITDLANRLDENRHNITLCVRAGFYGRSTPLVVNLPLSQETMDIVVLTTGSAAATELQHPDVDAPP